ncbi:MAG: hypothetical protein AN484_20505 [Aphanizomenon flos-aquae WA102]|uniref:Uncharacterized protein n=1 Tax=Aphanizomenon flos-aquae WA102 TaxID=1710896 RepID=A0A1B7WX14_APHFL|nr:MAG: hypothetical protein AN484_20505 [Aphanizomenon flos-aquae WA102]
MDIEEWKDAKDIMQKNGFAWTYENADAMHFDCKSSTADIRVDSIKAFQILWNKATPRTKFLLMVI